MHTRAALEAALTAYRADREAARDAYFAAIGVRDIGVAREAYNDAQTAYIAIRDACDAAASALAALDAADDSISVVKV